MREMLGDLAAAHGLEIRMWPDVPRGATGALVWNARAPYIVLKAGMSEEAECDTIAHEIGHWLLGHHAKGEGSDPEQERQATMIAIALVAAFAPDAESAVERLRAVSRELGARDD